MPSVEKIWNPGPSGRADRADPVLAAGILGDLGQALRRVRDASRNRTRIGERLFESLFDEYHRFSRRICRQLAGRPEGDHFERFLAEPLERVFGLACDYSESPLEFERLGREVLADAAAGAFLPNGSTEEWKQAAVFLSATRQARRAPLPAAAGTATAELARRLGDHLARHPHAVWGMVEPLRLYAEMRLWLDQCGDDPPSPAAVGTALAYAFDDWLARVPSDTWNGLPVEVVARDLDGVAQALFA